MPRIPFIGRPYLTESLLVDSNIYYDIDVETKEETLYGRPGLSVWLDTGVSAEVRNIFGLGSNLFAVVGSSVFKIDTSKNKTSIGSLLTSSGHVWIESNNHPQTGICDGTNYYYIESDTLYTNPSGVIGGGSLSLMDTYFIVHSGNEFQPSGANDGSTWDALNFVQKQEPDGIVTTFSDHKELWVFGSKNGQVWYDVGGSPFPFAQVPGGYFETGLGAAASPAKVDESIFWLTDAGQVVRAVQYSPQVISSRRMEWNIAQYSRIDDAIGWRCSYGGRHQYHLSFPSAGCTWVYEPQTQKWHRRTSAGTTGNWRANCCTFFNGEWLVGDYENGIIYKLDSNVYDDNGSEIDKIWTFPSLEEKGKRIPHSKLEFVVEAGVGSVDNSVPQLALTWSNDGEKTFGNEVWRSPGQVGKYKQKVIYNGLGMSRQRTYRIRQTDKCKFALRNVFLNEGL